MDKLIRDHADAIYVRESQKVREKSAKVRQAVFADMNKRGFTANGGMVVTKIAESNAAAIGETMRARLESFQTAFADAKLNPAPEDFQDIWNAVKEEYSRSTKNLTGQAAAQAKSEGRAFDPSTEPVTAPAMREHDKVLAEFNIWRSRVGLASVKRNFDIQAVTPLKQLPSKEACDADLQSLLDSRMSVGVLYMDLDNFKAVNDKHGHESGDSCIENAAEIFVKAVQHKGRLYRLHGTGDEFVVLLPNYDEAEARATAERIRLAIEQQSPGGDITVTASIGGVVVTNEISSQEALILADKAMYEAKKSRNTIHFGSDPKVPASPSKVRSIEELLALRRDRDNENGQIPSPGEIAEAVRKAPLYQREEVAKSFVGIKVCWKAKLNEVVDRKNIKGEMGVQFSTRMIDPTIHVIVRLNKYPILKTARGGEYVEITGLIERTGA